MIFQNYSKFKVLCKKQTDSSCVKSSGFHICNFDEEMNNSQTIPPTRNQNNDDNDDDRKLLIPFRKGDKWGFCYREKVLKIGCFYDKVEAFEDGFAFVKSEDGWGVISESGEVIIPLVYSWVTKHENLFSVIYGGVWDDDEYKYVGSKMGVFDTWGREVVPVIYDSVRVSCLMYVVPELDEKFGLIKLGEGLIFDCIYDKVGVYTNETDGVLYIKTDKDGDTQILDAFLQPLDLIVGTDYNFIDDTFITFVHENGKVGLVDAFGKALTSIEYDEMSRIGEFIKVKKSGKFGIINCKGKVIVPCYLDRFQGMDGDVFVGFIDDKVTLIKETGEVWFEPKYSDCHYITDTGICFWIKVGEDAEGNPLLKCGVVDFDDNVIIPFIYDEINFFDDFSDVVLDGKHFTIDRQGDELFPERYECKTQFCGEYCCVCIGEKCNAGPNVKNNGKWGVIKINGQVVLPIIYDKIYYIWSLSLYRVSLNEVWGYISVDGTEYWED